VVRIAVGNGQTLEMTKSNYSSEYSPRFCVLKYPAQIDDDRVHWSGQQSRARPASERSPPTQTLAFLCTLWIVFRVEAKAICRFFNNFAGREVNSIIRNNNLFIVDTLQQ
jgi:hypothetical protein